MKKGPMMQLTHSLVMDTTMNTFCLVSGTKEEILAEHKKWMLKIKKNEWLSIPEILPVSINRQGILALRVVEIPAEMQGVYNTLSDPRRRAYAERFLNQASQFKGQMEEKAGVDLLDEGFKQ
jgi:hypothetical protein